LYFNTGKTDYKSGSKTLKRYTEEEAYLSHKTIGGPRAHWLEPDYGGITRMGENKAGF